MLRALVFVSLFGGGVGAFFFFLGSLAAIWKKRYELGLVLGVLELLSAAASSFTWAGMLRESGKADWFLFGIFRYTPIGLVCFSMFIAGALCVLASVWGLKRSQANASQA